MNAANGLFIIEAMYMATNSEVVHAWANQTGQNRRGGNIHYEGTSLYSYSTEIARLMNGYAISTTEKYSVTTTGKHMYHVPSAVSHLVHFSYSGHLRNLSTNWITAKFQLLEDYEIRFKQSLDLLPRKRAGIISELAYLAGVAEQIVTLQNQCKGVTDNYRCLAIADSLDQRLRTLNVFWNIDLTKKLEKERAADEQREKKQREKERLQAILEAEKAEAWRKGEYNSPLYNLPVMLRCLDNETIETSKGAKMALQTAVQAYTCLLEGKNIIGTNLEGFTVSAVTDNHIKIGCHTVPRSEIENLLLCKLQPMHLVQ